MYIDTSYNQILSTETKRADEGEKQMPYDRVCGKQRKIEWIDPEDTHNKIR